MNQGAEHNDEHDSRHDSTDATGEVGLDAAYDLQTPQDNKRLYQAWASSYDQDFVDRHSYVYHREVTSALLVVGDPSELEPVLDVGCGTGIVGSALWEDGVRDVHGLDISPEMLAEAERRTAADGQAVYRTLTEADLTMPLRFDDETFGAIISSGTFTHGHVGSEALDELVRIVRPGGVLCLGVNEQFYQTTGFREKIEELVNNGSLADCQMTSARIYDNPPAGHEDDTALAVTLTLPA